MLNFFKKIALFASAALIIGPVFANPLEATPSEAEANPASQIEQASPPIMELAAADEVSSAPATTEATAEKTEKTAKKQHHRHHRKTKKEETKSESSEEATASN